MAKQTINIGSAPDDGTGETIRNALDKTNDNFDELYTFAYNVNSNNVSVGNTSVNSFVNSSLLTIGTSLRSNSTGVYHTGLMNAASFNVGTSFKANTTGVYHTGLMNAASFNVGASFAANTTRITISNTVNIIANGVAGNVGQLLTSNGTSLYWQSGSIVYNNAEQLMSGEEGIAVDFISRTIEINDYADTLSNTGRPDSILTVSRASTKMVTNRNRLLASVAANTLAYDHDPVTGDRLGVLIEPAATNVLIRSEDFTNIVWNSVTNTVTVVTQTGVDDPAGGTTAGTIRNDTGPLLFRSISGVSVGVTYTYSIWVRLRSGSGTCSIMGGPNSGATVFTPTTSWVRYSDSGLTNDTNARAFLSVVTTGLEVDVWGGQLELGSVATSYIPTVASSVTRNADAVSIATSLFPHNALQGTLFVEYSLPNATGASRAALTLGDGTNNERFVMRADADGSPVVLVIDGNVSQTSMDDGSVIAINTVRRHAMAYALNDIAHCYNGGTVGTDTSATLPTVTSLNIGQESAGGIQTNGHIRRAAYYSRRMTNAEIQRITV
jgi:hypothetical protein